MSVLRRTQPYGYYISYDQKRAYPFSRDYTSLGCPRGVICRPPEDATEDPMRKALLRLPLIKDLISIVLEWYGDWRGDCVSFIGAAKVRFPWIKAHRYGKLVSRIYLYDDSCSPWTKYHYKSYFERKALFEQNFQVVPWGTTEIDVTGFECGGELHYQCPLCWTRYKKNGEPYGRAGHAFHRHGGGGFPHSEPTSREVPCDKGVCGMISRVNITLGDVHHPKCKCHRKLKSAGTYSAPYK